MKRLLVLSMLVLLCQIIAAQTAPSQAESGQTAPEGSEPAERNDQAAFGQVTLDDFDSIVNFSVSLEELQAFTDSVIAGEENPGTFLILDGAVSSLTILDPEEQSFIAVIELVSGNWIGLDEVAIHKCFIQVEGPDFHARIPRREPRNPEPEIISKNDRILVAGQLVDLIEMEDGELVPLLYGHYIRPIN